MYSTYHNDISHPYAELHGSYMFAMSPVILHAYRHITTKPLLAVCTGVLPAIEVVTGCVVCGETENTIRSLPGRTCYVILRRDAMICSLQEAHRRATGQIAHQAALELQYCLLYSLTAAGLKCHC